MSIAKIAFGAIGPKIFIPEGPLGTNSQFPFPQFDFGEVVMGDKESQYVYLQLNVTSAMTMNQGDVLVWDNSYSASPALAAASQAVVGSGVGTFFLGGRFGDPASAPNANAGFMSPLAGNAGWSFTFQPGQYAIWAQRFGSSLVNYTGGVTAQGDTTFTTAVAGSVGALASAPTHGATIVGMFPAASSIAFTCTTTAGSNILTAVAAPAGNALKGIVKGMPVQLAGVPVGSFILDFGADTITLGNSLNSAGPNATATGTAIAATASNGAMWATFASGAFSAKVSGQFGVYPNATLTGTGVGTGAIVNSFVGNPGSLTLNVSVAFTATETTPVLLTATNYVEGFLRLPIVTAQS
jgi:hypothetical protein